MPSHLIIRLCRHTFTDGRHCQGPAVRGRACCRHHLGARTRLHNLPRKMLLGALRSALSAKLRDGELKVVQAFDLGGVKTKEAKAALTRLEATRKVLVVENGDNRNLTLG